MDRSQRDLSTPPLSLRVFPPLFQTKASQNLPSLKKEKLCTTDTRDQRAPLRKRQLSVQARSSFCELSSLTTFQSLGS